MAVVGSRTDLADTGEQEITAAPTVGLMDLAECAATSRLPLILDVKSMAANANKNTLILRKQIKFTALVLFLSILVAGCETTPNPSRYESPECRRAKADNAFCMSDCLISTPGGFLGAMGRCGNTCRAQTLNVRQICG